MLPEAAGLSDEQMQQNARELVDSRDAFGGATVAREKLGTAVRVFAVMPKTFDAEGASAGAGNVVSPALSVSSAVRCTKSLADFEWLGEDRIIGLSGAKTAPDLWPNGEGTSRSVQ